MIETLAIAGYRSLRDVRIALGPLTIVTGPNGSGKSSLYRALRLLADVAQGQIIASLAAEGGLQSTLWAGPESFSRDMKAGIHPVQGTLRSGPVSLRMGFAAQDYGYAVDLGLPIPSSSRFARDPEIKAEALWMGPAISRTNLLAERRGGSVRLRDSQSGSWRPPSGEISANDSMMSRRADMGDGLEMLLLRDRMREWRFYDNLRTDRTAPARRPQTGTFTPILCADGGDIGAAVQTIIEIGDAAGLQEVIGDAFDGATLEVGERFEIGMRQYGLLRPLTAAELSDGTLRYILLTAALLSPRPPELMILNEPEASLHTDLLAPLARLLLRAAKNCQIIVISHATELVRALETAGQCTSIRLRKELGETIADQCAEPPLWTWPSR